jgi:hypothetical protein
MCTISKNHFKIVSFLSSFKRRSPAKPLIGVAGIAAMVSISAGIGQGARAATVNCQATNATSIINNVLPSPSCSNPVAVGDTFVIDFSSVFNSTDFAVSNKFSLQLANLAQVAPTVSLNFADVQLLITGSYTSGSSTFNFTEPTAISIWQATGQTGQGISNYAVNGSGQNFGFGTAYKSANFTLSGPNTPSFGTATAGLINTIPLDLSSVGVTSFTSAKIVGRLAASTTSAPTFSAGLGIFTTNNPATQPPNIIFGNAYNLAAPGPLPVLGAGAAFGWSRRLRRRIGASKPAA